MQKKKILHFISGLEVGGAEMMLLKILPHMQNDFDNRVCALLGDGQIGEKLRKAGIKTDHLNFSLNIFGSIWKFKRIVKEFKPDILVTYLIHADLFGRIFGRIFGIKKTICSQRGVLLNWEWLRFFDRLTKSLVTKYTVQTETVKSELMQKLKLPESKFVVIPNGINLTEFNFEINVHDKKTELKLEENKLNIACVSNLHECKGHKYLLEAFEKIFEKNKNINLLIIGDGKIKQILIDQIKHYDSKNNIYFLGKRSDVKEILKISDIFVLPTLGEGMSNAILEALASSLPVITTNIPVNKEIITNNVSGLLVKPGKSEELSEKLQFLIENPEIRKELGSNGKKLIENKFTISEISSKWIEVLKSL